MEESHGEEKRHDEECRQDVFIIRTRDHYPKNTHHQNYEFRGDDVR